MRSRGFHRLTVILSVAAIFTTGHLITSPASLHVRPTEYPGIGIGADRLFGRLPGHQLYKREIDCDQLGIFHCATGTCFTADDGLVGCCAVASCAPRTICMAYTTGITSPCDINTGGCTYCSDPASPDCLTITNTVANQWVHYCESYASTETMAYTNSITGGSQADETSTSTSSTSISENTEFTPQPAMCVQPPCVNTASSTESAQISEPSFTYSPPSTTLGGGAASPVATTSSETAAATGHNATVAVAGGSDDSAEPQQSPGISRGVVAGIICGGAAAGALIFAAVWYTKKRWLTFFCPSRHGSDTRVISEKHSSANSSPLATGKDGAPAESEGSTPLASNNTYSAHDFARHLELESYPVSTQSPQPIDNVTVRGLGIGSFSPRRYVPTNPDPMPATDEGSPTDDMPPARPGVSEVSGEERPLPASPPVSSLAPPDTPHTDASSRTSSNSAPVSPLTPTYRYMPYTPSAYGGGNEPPSSIPRTLNVAPPSMPQDYSAVSLGSTANIYRGLSRSGGAPWAYLSPEEAVRGGWRNDESGL